MRFVFDALHFDVFVEELDRLVCFRASVLGNELLEFLVRELDVLVFAELKLFLRAFYIFFYFLYILVNIYIFIYCFII